MTEEKGTALVRPGDITDAADSEDLARALFEQNAQRIDETAEVKNRVNLSQKDAAAIRKRYNRRAQDVYDKLWGKCKSSVAGHDFAHMDSHGKTVVSCQTCGYVTAAGSRPSSDSSSARSSWDSAKRQADDMNRSMAQALASEMMAVDQKAGLLEFPIPDDYTGRERTRLGRRRR